MTAYRDWRTLFEIDQQNGWTKGSAFRRFKRIEAGLNEGQDFRVLHHQHDREAIESLREQGRIYASSVNLLLVSDSVAARLCSAHP